MKISTCSALDHSVNTIDLVRFFAIFFMMLAHFRIDQLTSLAALQQPVGVVYQALYFGLSRTSSAFLGIASGYFVYRQISQSGYQKTLRKRFNSLVVPSIIWSSIFLLISSAVSIVTRGTLPNIFFDGPWRMFNTIVPIQFWQYNFPLHYLTDLFKLCLAAPILIYLVERMSLNWKILAVVLLALFPNSISDPANDSIVIPRWDLVVFFVAGLAIASSDVDLERLMRDRIQTVAVVSAFSIILAFSPFWEQLMKAGTIFQQYIGYLMVMAVKVAGIFLFVGVAQRCASSKLAVRFAPSRETIFVAFCIHAIVVFFLARIAMRVGGALGFPVLVSFLAFLVFPAISFLCASLLVKIRGRAFANLS